MIDPLGRLVSSRLSRRSHPDCRAISVERFRPYSSPYLAEDWRIAMTVVRATLANDIETRCSGEWADSALTRSRENGAGGYPAALTALLMNRIDIEGAFLQAQDLERH